MEDGGPLLLYLSWASCWQVRGLGPSAKLFVPGALRGGTMVAPYLAAFRPRVVGYHGPSSSRLHEVSVWRGIDFTGTSYSRLAGGSLDGGFQASQPLNSVYKASSKALAFQLI